MKHKLIIYIFTFFLVFSIFASLLPYPIFSRYTNITSQNAYEINNFKETEQKNHVNENSKILSFGWFNCMDNIFEINCIKELIDLETEESYFIVRTGGINHADIEPAKQEDLNTMYAIYQTWQWTRKPVLLKLNETTYVPASLSIYPHGFFELEHNFLGHFCLHFKNSKTHGTNRIDEEHQKTIKEAIILGQEYLKKI